MINLIERKPSRFRVEVYDKLLHKTKSRSFSDGDEVDCESLIEMITDCITKREYRKYKK